MFRIAIALAAVLVWLVGLEERPAAQQKQRNDGVSTVCGEWEVLIINAGIFGSLAITAPDEGWAYVDPNRKRVQATGIAYNVVMANNDTPANHYSHDLDFKIELDPNQEDLLSIQLDNGLPVEWEAGIKPEEKFGDGAQPIFPKWAWPSRGDRVWVDGNWIHDCGHPDEDSDLYKTEIHPARAIATTRKQAVPLPGTGLTPVQATLTDVYISGNGGFAPNQLNCGPDIILGTNGSTCGEDPPPADTSYKTTPINDTDFSFPVCLPGRPLFWDPVPIYRVENGPGNTVGIEMDIDVVDATGPCSYELGYAHDKMLQVTVPLKDTATPPTAVFARKIYAGWLWTPSPVLPHRRVTLVSTDLHEDHDLDPGDGELTFWWLGVNRGGHQLPNGSDSPWLRLSDFADGNMNDYDDDTGPGDGEMTYSNASFDFYIDYAGQFTVTSTGFEQDCFDNAIDPLPDGTFFKIRQLLLSMYVACYADFADAGAGDAIGGILATFNDDDLGLKSLPGLGGQYDMRLLIEEVAPDLDDTSYLSVQTSCTPKGEVALVNEELTCNTRVDNAGTGLPRETEIKTTFPGTPTATVDDGTWAVRTPFSDGVARGCADDATESVCRPIIVPVAANAPVNVVVKAIPTAPGILTERAEVKTKSKDPDLTNNVASTTIEVYRSIAIDVSPKNDSNEVELSRGGTVTVAILTTNDFDAASVDPLTVCFGDAGTPSERSCSEAHKTGHLEDVNKDKRADMVLHFDVKSTGIDLGDTSACVIARTYDGIGLYGCGAAIVQ